MPRTNPKTNLRSQSSNPKSSRSKSRRAWWQLGMIWSKDSLGFGVSKRKRKAEVLLPGQWLLATHDGRQVFVPNPNHERGRNCGIGNSSVSIIGSGTIGNSSVSINNVWLVYGLKHNQLSISQ